MLDKIDEKQRFVHIYKQHEGYGRFNLNLKDNYDMLTFPGFWKVIDSNLMSGINEFKDSFYKPGYTERLSLYKRILYDFASSYGLDSANI